MEVGAIITIIAIVNAPGHYTVTGGMVVVTVNWDTIKLTTKKNSYMNADQSI